MKITMNEWIEVERRFQETFTKKIGEMTFPNKNTVYNHTLESNISKKQIKTKAMAKLVSNTGNRKQNRGKGNTAPGNSESGGSFKEEVKHTLAQREKVVLDQEVIEPEVHNVVDEEEITP